MVDIEVSELKSRATGKVAVVSEEKAAEILREKVCSKSNGALALLVPECPKQERWSRENESTFPKEVEVVLQKKGTEKLISAKAWLLQLGADHVKLEPESITATSVKTGVVETNMFF